MSVTTEQPAQVQQERIVALYESGSTVRDIALLEGISEYKARRAINDYRQQVKREWQEHSEREQHEEWRDYGNGVFVRWCGNLHLAVLESNSRYRYYLRCEERRLFDSSDYCYRSHREAMQAAERQARSHAS